MILKDSNRHYRNTLTINGNISDDGGARNLSHHFDTFTLNGSNSFGGGVTLQSGELSIGNDFALGTGPTLSVYNGAILEAGRGDRTIRNTKLVQDWCTLLIHRGTNNLTFAASQDLKGAFDYVYPDGPRYRVVETNGVLTFGGLMRSGTIHKAGMTKEGPGTFVIDGPYYCALKTVVADGTLILNGTTTSPNSNSGYTVMAGATLGGTGVVNLAASGSTCTVQRAGALSPGTHRTGSRVGTLRVNGPVSLAEGARFKWDCQDGAGDLLNVNGRLSLPAVATVVVSRISGELPESATLMTANSLAGPGAGDVSGWVVQGVRGVRLQVADNAVILERFQPGTLFLVR
jgi:fibronectin-binding autotransporter adhesin